MSIKNWNYKYDADITFGEVHVSKLPKIILGFTFLGLAVLGVTAYLFKDHIYDYTTNPQLQFNDKVSLNENGEYTVDYEISNSAYFKPEAYMEDAIYDKDTNTYNVKENLPYQYKIEGDDITKADTVGEYTVSYLSKNRVRMEQKDLKVNLVDLTPPTITFELSDKAKYHVELDKAGSCQLTLIKGKDTDNFDPKNYVKSIKDNYCKDEELIIDYPKVDISKIVSTTDTFDLIYSATDTAGNMGTANLKLIFKEDVDKIKEEQEKALKEAEEEKRRLEEEKKKLQEEKEQAEKDKKDAEENSKPDNTNTPTSTQSPVTTQAPYQQTPAATQAPVTTQPPATTEAPSIRANDVTISISAGEDAIVQKCIENVIFRGTTGSAQPEGMPGFDCQLKVGTYIITWRTTNGLSCTQKLTITE